MTTIVIAFLLMAGEADAQKLWTERCASCHAVPNPKLDADRVWIDQVRRTT